VASCAGKGAEGRVIDARLFTAQRIVDPLFWGVVKRLPVRRRLAEFRKAQWDEAGVYRERRDRRLAALLTHAVTRVPYYRDRVGGLSTASIERDPLRTLGAFPVLERSDLHDHFDELTCEMGRGTERGSSGGSTGTPVRFLRDGEYIAAATAARRLAFEWAGVGLGERCVRLWGARRDLPTGRHQVRGRFGDLLYGRLTLDAFRMGDGEMADYVRRINRFRPAFIEAYADAAHELAVFARRSGLELVSPRSIVTGATTLFPHMREEIAEAFDAPVFDRYGSREVGVIASECDRHRGLHVFGECAVVEIVDGEGRPVDPGGEGEILVTNLWNYTMPFIRYRIGDVAVRGTRGCSCGRPYPILERVVGRAESRFVRPAGGVVLPEFFIHLIGVEYNNGAIRKFQVVQEAPDRIVVRVVPFEDAAERALAHREEIARHITDRMGAPCSVTFVVEDDIEPTRTGKHLYTVSRLEDR
jgi:phenylacetate-CoA ligase